MEEYKPYVPQCTIRDIEELERSPAWRELLLGLSDKAQYHTEDNFANARSADKNTDDVLKYHLLISGEIEALEFIRDNVLEEMKSSITDEIDRINTERNEEEQTDG